MDLNQEYIEKLLHRNIKPTSSRLLVLKTLIEAENALSMSDIEARLGTLDKSSVFRTLTLFLENKLVHSIDDGSGAIKYAVCTDECECSLSEEHIHFSCTKCGKTFCLTGLHIPIVRLPKGFRIESANFVYKGICSECKTK